MNFKAWLDHLYYDIGNQMTDFRLTTSDKEGNYSKWISYLKAQETGQIYFQNQREQLKNEIIFDMDEGDLTDYSFLINRMVTDGIALSAFKTRSNRARHIHTYWRGLAYLPREDRYKFREMLLKKYNCDPHYKIDKKVIPIEYAVHWKTGEVKELFYTFEGENYVNDQKYSL